MSIAVAPFSEDKPLHISGIAWFKPFQTEIHKKVFIYVYLQFKSEFKENYLALTSLNIPLSFSISYHFHNSLCKCIMGRSLKVHIENMQW